jgi:glycosyltransferase involved in cell wall biosynthesis
MATYNGEKYIAEQLHSILEQLGKSDELIISDDHSTDNTIRVIEECADPRIKLVYNNTKKGYTRNFENAIRCCVGDIIFISDQDDVWMDNKVEVMKQYLDTYDLVISDATYVNENLQVIHDSHFRLSCMKTGFFRQLYKPCYIGACMAFKRVVLEIALPFPQHERYCAYDYWLSLVGECCYNTHLVENQLILYRRHGGNASPAGGKSPNSLFHKSVVRAYSFAELAWRISTRGMAYVLGQIE